MPVVVEGLAEKAAVDTLFGVAGISPYMALTGDDDRWYTPLFPRGRLFVPPR